MHVKSNLDYIWAAFIFLFFLVVYLLTISQNFGFDSLTNALACESGDPARWLHPNHPFHPFLGVLWYKGERFFGYAGYSIYSLARFNIVFAALGLGLLYLALIPFVSRINAVVTSFFLGASFCIWRFVVDARSVGASVFFLIWVIYYMTTLERRENIDYTHALTLSALSVLAVLVHGLAIFLIPACGIWLWKRSKQLTGLYLMSSIAMLGGVLILIFVLFVNQTTGNDFFRWVIGYAAFEGTEKTFQSLYWTWAPLALFRGLWDGWRAALVQSGSEGALPSILSHGSGVYAAILTIWSFLRLKKIEGPRRQLAALCLNWGLFETFFLFFWSAGAVHFRILVMVPWVTAWTLALGDRKYFWKSQLGMAALFFSLNFSNVLYPEAFLQNNVGYQALKEVRTHVKPGDFIITNNGSISNIHGLRPYFFPEINGGTLEGRLYEFGENSLDPLRMSLKKRFVQGHAIYFTEDLFEVDRQAYVEKRFSLKPGAVRSFLAHFRLDSAFNLPHGPLVYQVIGLNKPS